MKKMTKLTKLSVYTLVCAMGLTTVMTAKPADAKKVTVKKIIASDSITGNKKTVTVAKGKTVKLNVAVTTKPDKAAYKKVAYKSKNAKIATVSSKGVIKGIKAGSTNVTVTSKKDTGKKAVIKVKVVNTAVTNVKLDRKSCEINAGEKFKLNVTVKAGKGAVKTVGWSSSNEKVASVDSKGTVTALKGGTTAITATAADGSGKKASCKITVNDKTEIKDIEVIDPQTVSIELNRAYELTKDNIAVYKKDNYDGEYRNVAVIESLTSTDNVKYTISLDAFSHIRERQYVQVSIPTLSGKVKNIETQYKLPVSAYVSEEIWKMKVDFYYDYVADIKESKGMTDMIITGLPAGLKSEKKGALLHVTGIPTSAGITDATLTAVDEIGNTWKKTIRFVIGSETVMTGAATTDYRIMGTNEIQYAPDEELIREADGSTKSIYHDGFWKKEENFRSQNVIVAGGTGHYYFTLAPNGDPNGIVQYKKDDNGNPVPEKDEAGNPISGKYEYDVDGSNGSFVYKVSKPGTYTVTVRATDDTTEKFIDVVVPVNVAAGVTVKGKITDAQGGGISGAFISFTNRNKAELYPVHQPIYTDVNGEYSVHIVPGNYDIAVSYGESGYNGYIDDDGIYDSTVYLEAATADKFLYDKRFEADNNSFNIGLPLYKVHITGINQTLTYDKDGKIFKKDVLKTYSDGTKKTVPMDLRWEINNQYAGRKDTLYLKPGQYTIVAEDGGGLPYENYVIRDGVKYRIYTTYKATINIINSSVEVVPTTTTAEKKDPKW